MAVDPSLQEDTIPCDICGQQLPFGKYFIHVTTHNNDKQNNIKNKINDNKALIPCEHSTCNLEIPFDEYESHLLIHRLTNVNTNNNNNDNTNKVVIDQDQELAKAIQDSNNIYVSCIEPSCNKRISIQEYDAHLLSHKLVANGNIKNDNNDNNDIVCISCDYPGCNENISFDQYQTHVLQHKQNDIDNNGDIDDNNGDNGNNIDDNDNKDDNNDDIADDKDNDDQKTSVINNNNDNDNKDDDIDNKNDDNDNDDDEKKIFMDDNDNKSSVAVFNDNKSSIGSMIDISSFLCILCKQNQGYDIRCSLSHKLCIKCTTEYILSGISTSLWNKSALSCPSPLKDCVDGVIPSWLINDCKLNKKDMILLESMQNEYIKHMDPTKIYTSCPKCNETYCTEIGDIRNENLNKNEFGVNGKLLSLKHKKHKIKYRFRCSKKGCSTIFCSGCKLIPYHIGYTCDEYKIYKVSNKCRFCDIQLNKQNIAKKNKKFKKGLNNVCNGKDCLDFRKISCDLSYKKCGHNCIGLRGHKCLPHCLNKNCLPKNADITQDEYCNICWVDPLRASPCIQLKCKHIFHFQCLKQKINKKWPSARITFGFLSCPLCKQLMIHPALKDITSIHFKLRDDIKKSAIERVKIEGLQNDPRLKDKKSIYYNNLAKYALDRLAYYPCSKCKKPYFGGMKRCEEAGREQAEQYEHNDLVCGSCASGDKREKCQVHGTEYISYKCKYCCGLAVWFCWGNTHFCDPCHRKAWSLKKAAISTLPKCKGKDKCPLGITHPANGTQDYCLGCVVCLRK